MTTINTIKEIRELNLESKIEHFLKNSTPQTNAKFLAFKKALKPEIGIVAERAGINPTLPDYLAYKYHIKEMSIDKMIEYFRDELQIEVVNERILKYWMHRFGIPLRNRSEALSVKWSKRIIVSIGLPESEFKTLVYAARGHTQQETADSLGVKYLAIKSHRSRIFRRLGVRGIPLYDITQAIILGYESQWFSDERVITLCGEIEFQEKLEKSINKFKNYLQTAHPISSDEAIVLYCAARGYGLQETADLLGTSYDNVRRNRSAIFMKLNVSRIDQAVILGYESGWFDDKNFKDYAKIGKTTAHDINFHPVLKKAMLQRGIYKSQARRKNL